VTSNVAWCTESYPTQNQNIKLIDPPTQIAAGSTTPTIPSGVVANYTSHTTKNTASNTCTASAITIPTTNYAYDSASGTRFARHRSATTLPWENNTSTANTTCDRTVLDQSLAWPKYPLLSPTNDLESAIISDSSYFCTMSFDNNGPKGNKYSPSSGCCDPASVYVTTNSSTPSTAHLEPDVSCKIPTY
jgi:hypothetical protein